MSPNPYPLSQAFRDTALLQPRLVVAEDLPAAWTPDNAEAARLVDVYSGPRPDWFDNERPGGWEEYSEVVLDHLRIVWDRWRQRVPVMYQGAHLDESIPQHAEILRWHRDPAALNCWLVGAIGSGKTWTGWALAHRVTAETACAGPGRLPVVTSLAAFLDAVRQNDGQREGPAWDTALNARWLFLDDIGHARPSEWTRETVKLIADHRVENGLRTVLASNATWDALVDVWGEPLMDRFRQGSAAIRYTGESRRRPLW